MALPTVGSTNPWVASAMARRDVDRLEQIRADRGATSGDGVEPAELGVGAEPAGDPVDPLELAAQDLGGRHQHVAVGHDHLDGRSERPGSIHAGRPVGRAQVEPLVTGAGSRALCGADAGGLSEADPEAAPPPGPVSPATVPPVPVLLLEPVVA